MFVKKNTGRKEKFSIRKLKSSISNAIAPPAAGKIAAKVEGRFLMRDEVESSELRKAVIDELESENKAFADAFAKYAKAARELSRGLEGLDARISAIVGKSGAIASVYGGIRIEVVDESAFDYAGVLRELLAGGFSITVEESHGKISLLAK